MICPRCKTEVSGTDTVCPSCKLKLIFKCPKCSSPIRIGAVSCKKCGHTFVKFCPRCHSANISSSKTCRKCEYDFTGKKQQGTDLKSRLRNLEEKPLNSSISKTSAPKVQDVSENPRKVTSKTVQVQKQKTKKINIDEQNVTANAKIDVQNKELIANDTRPLMFYIDFFNLDKIFEKYNKDEFTQKVIENIKTTIKLSFGAICEFINSHTVMFSFQYSKESKLLEKIAIFDDEILKFNQILEKTLDVGLSYKFAILTIDEAKNSDDIIQLKHGSDKDFVVSRGAYVRLNGEMSFIRISPDSYKRIFLDKKPMFQQNEAKKYDKALEIILNNLSDINSSIRAISVNAPRGAGKTHLLNNVYSRIKKSSSDSTIVFYAQCSALTQISPYGLIQSFFISLFDCPVVLKGEFNIKTFEKRVLDKLNLENIDPQNLETLANLVYPINTDYYENILYNKEFTHKYLKDIFDYIKERKNVIFIIDDFDLLDESSFSFLKYLVESDYFATDAKMILGYKNPHSISLYFQSSKLDSNNCLNISLKTQTMPESRAFIKKIIGQNALVPDDILSVISYNAQGNIVYIEQILQYLFENKSLYISNDQVKFNKKNIDIILPDSLEKCIFERLDTLKKENEREYIFLNVASLLGDRLDYKILSELFELNENEFFEIVSVLEKKGYLKKKYDDIYGFKNSLTWSYCYIKAKEDELIKNYAEKLLFMLSNKIISTPLICPILAQIVDNKELAYNLWTKNLQYASFIGDVNIYAMAQKQSLILLNSINTDNIKNIKDDICERLGKLIYIKNPEEAKEYLSNAIASAKSSEDENKIIDLCGYMVKSAYLTQDYTGVVELVDNVLKYFDTNDRSEKKSTTELQIALIKTRKLNALLKLGSWEEITSLVKTEISPVLQKHLNMFSKQNWISQQDILYTWLDVNITLAYSYAQQGSVLAFDLISSIDKELKKDKSSKIDNLRVRLAFAMAVANTSRGYFDESRSILNAIVKDYSYILDDSDLISEWNIINLINKILKSDTDNINNELFEATAFANNSNNELAKNIFKTLLAYVFLQQKSYLKAIKVATEEMQYFSSKKTAFGALLAWYISAAATASNKADMYCIEICEKAVKICENVQNNNIYFKVLFQELLAKSYLKLNDRENAQMYCDLGIQDAKANQLLYLLVRLQRLKASILREILQVQSEDKSAAVSKILNLYNATIELAKKLNLKKDIHVIEKDLTSFKAYCQLNRITTDK